MVNPHLSLVIGGLSSILFVPCLSNLSRSHAYSWRSRLFTCTAYLQVALSSESFWCPPAEAWGLHCLTNVGVEAKALKHEGRFSGGGQGTSFRVPQNSAWLVSYSIVAVVCFSPSCRRSAQHGEPTEIVRRSVSQSKPRSSSLSITRTRIKPTGSMQEETSTAAIHSTLGTISFGHNWSQSAPLFQRCVHEKSGFHFFPSRTS